MKYRLQDLIDIDHFQNLQDRLNKIYSFPSSIIDNEGNILTATAWQDVCIKFHRKNKDTEQLCIESDQYILGHLHEANPAVSYRCPHGLVDNATPIIIDGIHYGNFFTGQFFLEEPDLDFFRNQAKKYGFDEEAYIEAIKKVPIWTQEQLENYLFFIKGLIAVISESGLKALREFEDRKRIEESREMHRSILKTAMDGFWLTDLDGRLLEVNDSYCSMSGYSEEELLSMRISDLEAIENDQIVAENMRKLVEKGIDRFESKHRRKDGTIFDVEISVQFRPDEEGQVVCFIRDITERKQAETHREVGREILQILNEAGDLQESIQRVLAALKTRTGVDAVGLRLQEGEDFPYFVQDGFSKDFLQTENTLLERHKDGGVCRDKDGNVRLECTCGLVISGKTDPSNPLFTQGGSCWTNDSFPLLDLPSDQDPRLHPRNNCIHQGYASMALIPVRIQDQMYSRETCIRHGFSSMAQVPVRTSDLIVGLIQLNDKRKGRFTLETIEMLEGIAAHVGSALIRKRIEDALRESEETHRALVDGLPDIVMRFDREGRHLFVSDNVREVIDIEAAQFIGKTHAELGFPEAQCRFWEESIRRVFDSGTPFETEFTVEGKTDAVTFNWRVVPERDAQGAVSSVLSISRDITAHRKAEQEYKTLFREMLDGFALHEIVCGAEGEPVDYRFLAVNPAFERMTGLKGEAIVGRTVLEVLPGTEKHWIETYGKVALSGEPVFFENYSSVMGRHFEVTSFRPAPGQFACIFQDITERKRAEEEREKLHTQLYQAQKMEAIGSLAGGVAHDLNNLLSPILGYGEILRDDLDPEDARRESVDEIISAGLRARDLVRQLLAFSRKQILEFKPLNLNKVAAGLERLLRYTIREDIQMEFDLAPDVGVVMADIGQIEQVIMNLSVNAADAMLEGGNLTIETQKVYLDEEYANHHTSVKPGEYVMLAVSDSGVGMDEATRERIFDPFFSTKGEMGTGLGLATVYGIVKQHGGNIWVYSEPGKGSTFKVYLPVVETSEPEETTSAETINDLKGSETILIVEDSDQVRRLAESVLKRNGYHVLTAKDGAQALEAMASHDRPVNLLLTDVVLPGMNGRELYEKAAEASPSMKVLFMSGYTDNVIAHRGVLDEGIQFIQKPFTVYGLAVKVREVLDEKSRK